MITDANTGVPAAALDYARAGLAIIPLHGVGPDGGCTCKDWTQGRNAAHGPGGKQTGKHPMGRKWTEGPALSGADVHAIWLEESPYANVGIRTGVVSGFWVLDVDPEAGGLESLRQLVDAIGPLTTYTVRTGGGGLHFYFLCPDFPVTNASNREIKRLFGPGLDIRGDGGQVVAPPSVSGKGAYVVMDGQAVGVAQERLLDLLRASAEYRGAGQVATHVVEDLPFAADLATDEQARVERYARTVIAAEAETYRNAVPGTGNETLFTSACSVLEIAQSPWNLVTAQEAFDALNAARTVRNATHPYRGGQDELEFAKTWASAQNRVVGQGRALPVAPDAGLGFDPSPFSPGPAGPGLHSGGYPLSPPSLTAASFSTGATSVPGPSAATGAPVTSGPGTAASSTGASQHLSVLDQLRARTLDRDELSGLQPPTPLIEGVLDEETLAVLAGQFGTFKTFIALDWLCCLATGTAWMGRAVPRARPVRIIAGEGASGVHARISAWEKGHGVRVPRDMLSVVRGAVQLGQADQIMAVTQLMVEREEAVVAFDTLAQCSVGLKENESDDQKRVAAAAAWIREHAGATTLLLHHAGHGGERARGSSAIEDNADASWFVSLTSEQNRHHSRPRRLEHRKTKDAELSEPMLLRFEQDESREFGGTGSGWLTASDSQGRRAQVVEGTPFVSTGPQLGVAPLRDPALLSEGVQTIAQVYIDVFKEGNGGTKAEVRRIAMAAPYNMASRTFYAAWNRLIEMGVIMKVHGSAHYRYLHPGEREAE